MFKLILEHNYLATLKEQAKTVILEDRKKYSNIISIAAEYVKKHTNVYLDSLEILDKDYKIEEAIASGELDKFDFFSSTPADVAKELAAQICKQIGTDLRLNVVFVGQEYLIEYDMRRLISIYGIAGAVPVRKIGEYQILPPMLKQLELLYILVDVGKFDLWEETLPKMHKVGKLIKMEQVIEIAKDVKPVVDIRVFLLEFFRGSKYILLHTSADVPLDIIFRENIDNLIGDVKTYLDKYTNLSIYFKNINLNVPKQPNLLKYSIFVSTHDKPVFFAYNIGTFTLIPFTKQNEAAPVLNCFITLANIWNSYNSDHCIRKYEKDRYDKIFPLISIKLYKYMGTYVDPIVKKKIDQLASRRFSSEKMNFACADFDAPPQ